MQKLVVFSANRDNTRKKRFNYPDHVNLIQGQ